MRLVAPDSLDSDADSLEPATVCLPPHQMQDFVSVLRWRAERHGPAIAFRFLNNGVDEASVVSYSQLDQQARLLAGRLQSLELSGQRVVLLYPSGADYLIAMLACFYAGVVAVPLHPPRPNRSAIASIACAIAPASAATAGATLASSELISRTISSGDRPSRSSEAGLRDSVVRCSSMNLRVAGELESVPTMFRVTRVLYSTIFKRYRLDAQKRYRPALPGLLIDVSLSMVK